MSNLHTRLAKIEAATKSPAKLSPEEFEASMLKSAAELGYTREYVFATFGGWPGFCAYRMYTGHGMPKTEFKDDGLSASERYFRMLKG